MQGTVSMIVVGEDDAGASGGLESLGDSGPSGVPGVVLIGNGRETVPCTMRHAPLARVLA